MDTSQATSIFPITTAFPKRYKNFFFEQTFINIFEKKKILMETKSFIIVRTVSHCEDHECISEKKNE